MAVGLNESQRSMARIIEQEFLAAGFNDVMVAAAIVNAKAESNLDPRAAGDSGQSIGLFQLYSKGAGAGMSVAQREDPVLNTRRIIQEVKSNYGKRLRPYAEAASGSPTSVAEATALFTEDIERPANGVLKGAERATKALAMFPAGVGGVKGLLTPHIPTGGTVGSSRGYWIAAISASALVVFGTTFYVAVKRATR
jgi:hypothetical protein